MERLTGKHYGVDGYYMVCSGVCSKEEVRCEDCHEFEKIVNTLGAIEDILGDTYDLDTLRMIMDAKRARHLFITPLKPGDSVYWLLEDNGWYVSAPEKVADVGTKGFYLGDTRDSADVGDYPSFIPWDELGKSVFLSREEAEAALEKKEV